MASLDHWHPVSPVRALRRNPVGITLCGQRLVLFRNPSGAVGALDDCCPHRRSKLSSGCLEGERLRCAYHGWTFDVHGHGESPGTPKLTAQATCYDTREAHGWVWVKSRDAATEFPHLDTTGLTPIGSFHDLAPCPLEILVDNFNELEHAGDNHTTFGFDRDRMAEVRVLIEGTDNCARMLTQGPTKSCALHTRWFIGYNRSYWFCSDTRTYFSPVHSVIDHWWQTPDGDRESRVRWRVFAFYVPVTSDQTDLVMFVFGKSRWPGAALVWPFIRPLMLHEFRREVRADVKLLGNMADYSPGIDGMKLSRFDRILGLTRERINRIYRGEAVPQESLSLQ
jgi:phenylpropionate dioxygenase-like ring-hydroxylating dioxygenase large terminal subunit